MELPQMDAAVHPFLASPPMLAAYPKLLPPATKNHLRVFQGRLDNLRMGNEKVIRRVADIAAEKTEQAPLPAPHAVSDILDDKFPRQDIKRIGSVLVDFS